MLYNFLIMLQFGLYTMEHYKSKPGQAKKDLIKSPCSIFIKVRGPCCIYLYALQVCVDGALQCPFGNFRFILIFEQTISFNLVVDSLP